MNLVAKEYVASRVRDTGSVVLSEFAGAAQTMSAAHLVNPHDREALKRSITAALNATPGEERRRMRSLRRMLGTWTSSDWADAFLVGLGRRAWTGPSTTPATSLKTASL
jgi:trehalose 6-phosphate synthase